MFSYIYSIFVLLFRRDTGISLNRRVTILPYYKGGNEYKIVVIRDDITKLNSMGSSVYACSHNGDLIDITQEPGVEYSFTALDLCVPRILVRGPTGDKYFQSDDSIVFDD